MRNFRIRTVTEVLTVWSKKTEMGWACGKYEGEERCIEVLVGKHEVKAPLQINSFKWNNNIRTFI